MRTLWSASTVTVAAVALALSAPSVHANAGGGTVTIHDGGTGELLEEDEPRVCTFTLHGSGFDVRRSVDWKIVEMPPTGTPGRVAEIGALALDEEGLLRSGTLSLEDGRYALLWNFDAEGGRAERRVFWIDCDGVPEEGGGDGGPYPSVSAPSAPGPGGTSEPSPGPSSGSPDTAGTPGSEPSPRVSPSGGADLAETGSLVPAGVLAATAASLLGAGACLVLRGRDRGARRG